MDDLTYHRHYLSLYLKISDRFKIPVIRTDENDIEQSFSQLLQWYQKGGETDSAV